MDAFLLSSILGEINAPQMELIVQKQAGRYYSFKLGVWPRCEEDGNGPGLSEVPGSGTGGELHNVITAVKMLFIQQNTPALSVFAVI